MTRTVTLALGEPGATPARTLPDDSSCIVIRAAPASGARGLAPWVHQGRGYSVLPRDVLVALYSERWGDAAVQSWVSTRPTLDAFGGTAAVLFDTASLEALGAPALGAYREATIVALSSVPARSHVLVWMTSAPTWARGASGSDAAWVPAVVEASAELDVESDEGNPLAVPLELFYREKPAPRFGGVFDPSRSFGAMQSRMRRGVPYRARSVLSLLDPPEVTLRWEPAATGSGLVDVPASGFGFNAEAGRTASQLRRAHASMFGA